MKHCLLLSLLSLILPLAGQALAADAVPGKLSPDHQEEQKLLQEETYPKNKRRVFPPSPLKNCWKRRDQRNLDPAPNAQKTTQ